MSSSDDGVSVGKVVVKAATEHAIKIQSTDPDANGAWVPRSVILDGSPIDDEAIVGEKGELIVSSWFAEKEGLA